MNQSNFVTAACTSECTNKEFSALATWMFRNVNFLPRTIWVGLMSVATFSQDLYTVPVLAFSLYVTALWYPLSRLFASQRPHDWCASGDDGMPVYVVYEVFADLVVSILHDVHWIGWRNMGPMKAILRALTIAAVLSAPVISGNYTMTQVMCSAAIGICFGLCYSFVWLSRFVLYLKAIEDHPVARFFAFKHTAHFQQKWLL